ncbi:hypothetical protein ACFL2Q_01380 [Thermodesulfobacteriota bacterium]
MPTYCLPQPNVSLLPPVVGALVSAAARGAGAVGFAWLPTDTVPGCEVTMDGFSPAPQFNERLGAGFSWLDPHARLRPTDGVGGFATRRVRLVTVGAALA